MSGLFGSFPKVAFTCSLAALVYGYGVLSHRFELFPYPQIKHGVQSVRLVVDSFGMMTKTRPDEHLFPSRYEGSGVTRHDARQVAPGTTLLTSFFDDGLEIRLLSADGGIVHRWPVSLSAIWPDLDHVQPPEGRPRGDWNVVFNGVHLEPDGSVVFPLHGLVKLDRCGEVAWKVPVMAHHSVERTGRGSYWTPSRHYVARESQHPPLRAPYEIDTLLEVSAEGEVLREIPVLDILAENDLLPILYANNRNFQPNPELDIVHLNDIEELPAKLADRFAGFEAGDLLLSLREVNMVLVLDPDSRRVKWHQVGPWIQQHDADWQADGTITVFDNRYDRRNGTVLGGSSVVSVDPATGEVSTLYGRRAGQEFYTPTQGDQQVLDNGNVLIAESDFGRVFEVTPGGEIAWEYINRYSADEVLRISDAVRYPPGYLQVTDGSCG